ncbi:MAG TPA: hypothetical protein VF040_21045 [Ktedonobacterales bacterium]
MDASYLLEEHGKGKRESKEQRPGDIRIFRTYRTLRLAYPLARE